MSTIPEDWTKTIQTEIHNRKNNRTVDINVNRNSKILDFKLCTTKQLYVMVVEKLYELPILPKSSYLSYSSQTKFQFFLDCVDEILQVVHKK
jgi:hypothetical protein